MSLRKPAPIDELQDGSVGSPGTVNYGTLGRARLPCKLPARDIRMCERAEMLKVVALRGNRLVASVRRCRNGGVIEELPRRCLCFCAAGATGIKETGPGVRDRTP